MRKTGAISGVVRRKPQPDRTTGEMRAAFGVRWGLLRFLSERTTWRYESAGKPDALQTLRAFRNAN
jgi:hypothetical protein